MSNETAEMATLPRWDFDLQLHADTAVVDSADDAADAHVDDAADDGADDSVKPKRDPEDENRKLSAENKKRLRQLNEERQKNADLEKRLKKIEDAKLAEDQRWQEIAQKRESEKIEAEQKANEKVAAAQHRMALSEAKRIARDKGMRAEAVRDLAKFIGAFEYDDDGEPIGLEDQIDDLKSSSAYLFQPPKGGVDDDADKKDDKKDKKVVTPRASDGPKNSLDIGKMTAEEYRKFVKSQYGVNV